MNDKLTAVLKERGTAYGDVGEQAAVAMGIIAAIRLSGNFEGLAAHMQQSLIMIAIKISRIVVGDPCNVDSWLDIEGYARLSRELINKPDGEGL